LSYLKLEFYVIHLQSLSVNLTVLTSCINCSTVHCKYVLYVNISVSLTNISSHGVSVFAVFKWSEANKNGQFKPRKVLQLFKSISCLRCGKCFKVYATFALHVKWCGREVCFRFRIYSTITYLSCQELRCMNALGKFVT